MQPINLFKSVRKFDNISFRNIYTIIESQNLFDDLISPSEEKNKVLQRWENDSSDISHLEKQKNRVFQYGNAENSIGGLFAPPYSQGRFGDGLNYGVWYGAMEQDTSILESLYHQLKRAQNAFKQKNAKNIIITERKMFQTKLQAKKCLDLNSQAQQNKDFYSQLTHPTNYAYCQEIGKNALANKIEMLLTPSARKVGGVCTPVFQEEIIRSEQFIYYLRWIFHRDGKVKQEKISQDKIDFQVPKGWI